MVTRLSCRKFIWFKSVSIYVIIFFVCEREIWQKMDNLEETLPFLGLQNKGFSSHIKSPLSETCWYLNPRDWNAPRKKCENFQRLEHRWERLTKTHKSVSFYFRQRESSKQLSFLFNRCPARNPLFLTDKFTFVSGLLGQPGVVHTYTTENF